MVLSFFSGGRQAQSVEDLIARKKYAQAVEMLRAQFQAGSRESRLRLQLADVLVLAGKGKEAVPILLGLADEFAVDGFAAKAISVLKKVQKLEPGRKDVDRRLAGLIKEKQRDVPTSAPRAAASEFGMEEIGIEAAPVAAAASTPASDVIAPDQSLPGFDAFEKAAAAFAGEPAPAPDAGALGDDLLGVIQQVLEDSRPAPLAPVARPAADSPLFGNFSEDELVAVIGGLELKTFEPGDILITEGERSDSLFVLTAGVVRAFVRNQAGRSVPVREMSEGAFFGEVSVLSGQPRSATVTACTRCELLELDRATLDAICGTHPHVREVLRQFYDQRARSEPELRARSGQ
ncbi:MAG: cyclic nucleotide-binding domain-containing protein [Vicinamibacteria bacterium]